MYQCKSALIEFEEKRKIGQGTAGIVYAAPYEKN